MVSVGGQRRRGLTRVEKQDLRSALLFIGPWIVGFFAFLAYPILMSLYYSLCDFSVLQPARFIGLANFTALAHDDVFLKALWNTMVYAVGAIPLGIILAFALAMLLNTGVGGMAVYRTIYFLPSLIPSVAMAILWLWILNGKSGILNYVIHPLTQSIGYGVLALLLGVPFLLGSVLAAGAGDARSSLLARAAGIVLGVLLLGWLWQRGAVTALTHLKVDPPNWLSDALWVKPALILMSLWGTGQAVVIYLAGLQDVPVHLYEAADLDGANWWQKTRNVTIPMVSPVILFNGIMSIIGTFNFFAIPFVMAPGGQPARSAYFLAVDLYDNVFQFFRMGYAAAMAWVLFIIVFVLTMLALKLSERHVHYGGA